MRSTWQNARELNLDEFPDGTHVELTISGRQPMVFTVQAGSPETGRVLCPVGTRDQDPHAWLVVGRQVQAPSGEQHDIELIRVAPPVPA